MLVLTVATACFAAEAVTPVTRCLSAISYVTGASLKSVLRAQLALRLSYFSCPPCLSPLFLPVLSLCLPLMSSLRHSLKPFHLSLPPPNKPLVLTLLCMACLLSGIPWQTHQKTPIFVFLFKIITVGESGSVEK